MNISGLPTFRNCLEGETSSTKRKNPQVGSRPARGSRGKALDRGRVPIYWEFGQLAKILHFVSKLDTSLYSKSMGNSCPLSYCCVPFENEAVKPIKSIHIWKANTITIPNMDMSVSVYRVGKKNIGCNIKNTEICRFLYWKRSFLTFLVHFQQNH